MATINQGIMSGVLGRVGPVNGYTRNGNNILRAAKNRGVVKAAPARIDLI